jgi:predicted lipid-binding transport protein (Tim44 family)
MKRVPLLAIMFLFFLVPISSWGRGGGGCIIEGTPVWTPNGEVAIERLKRGDSVWSVKEGRLWEARVQGLTRVQPKEYLEIWTADARVEVTSEHPLMVAPGEYRLAGLLKAGETVYLIRNGTPNAAKVQSIRRITAKPPAYNLLVSPGGTFVTAGVIVHNKGCFLPDSQILRADGTESMISAVRPGDELLAFNDLGRMVRTKVRDIIRHEVDEYILLKTDQITLQVTAEHPFYVGKGTYKTVEALKEGDTVFAWDGKWLSGQRIVSLQRVHERVQVYNLQNDHPNTFFAGRIAVHNKGGGGGCFPAGTKVATPNGPTAIETLTSGDEVLAVTHDGVTLRTTVKTIFISKNQVLEIKTGGGILSATDEHPVSLGGGRFRQAGDLRPGDHIVGWKDGRLLAKTVRKVSRIEGEGLVFNLQVDEPRTFVAEGIVVHNKGGGGSSGSRSSSSRSSSRSSGSGSSDNFWIVLMVLFIFIPVFLIIFMAFWRSRGGKKSENLDFVYGREKIGPKAGKTEKLLAFLSQQDPTVSPVELLKFADSTFRRLQECWEARNYEPMKPLMMTDLFNQHIAQIQGMLRNHEINRIESIKVEHIDLVNVRYTEKPNQREFTALITASARDYYVDDRDSKFIRGDGMPARFQEFWTFQRSGDQWLLREIEQAGESDVLKDENFAEMLTDDTVKGIYGEVGKRKGEAGPWLEKEVEEKATRIDRLLNFLVQTDKLWNRNQMIERARQVFLRVYLAKESCDPNQVPAADLFSEVAEHLRAQIQQWQKDGLKVEYRNLCVRKSELILVRNFADQAKDEYAVRISAHAQRVSRKGERIASEQAYVTPFEEYWTFGRLGNQWKLKEVLPPGRGKKKMAEENVDEESGSGQLQWYYRQPRAN